jgi:hypothetical protein
MKSVPRGNSRALPEFQLLLHCARLNVDTDRREQICHLAQQDLDWLHVVALAYGHMVIPLLHRHLSTICPDAVPPATLEYLRNSAENDAREALHGAAELSKILEHFRAEQIPAVVLKGLALAQTVYGDPTLRHFIGHEILIHRGDALRARAILKSQGFRPRVDLPEAHAAAFLRHQHEYVFGRVDSLNIHLCWQVAPRFFPPLLDTEALWTRVRTFRLAEQSAFTLSPEDLLLTLCVYSTKMHWRRLRRICDVAELIRAHPDLDWDAILTRAHAHGVTRMLFVGLNLARELLECEIPEAVEKPALGDAKAGALTGRARKWMLASLPLVIPPTESTRFVLDSLERVRDKLRYLLRLAFVPTDEDWARQPLPTFLIPLYAILRPFALLKRSGRANRDSRVGVDLGRYEPVEEDFVGPLLKLANVGPSDVVYDLGCGDGRIVIAAAKQFGAQAVGVDIDPRRIAEAKRNAREEGVQDQVRFLLQDAQEVDLSKATVVTLFLSWSANYKLRPLLQSRLPRGAKIVSVSHDMGDWIPDKVEEVQAANGVRWSLFLWHV